MQMTLRRLALLVLSAGFVCQAPAQASVIDYVKIPDKEYRWELKSKTETPEGTVYDLHLVSQVWQGITWEHRLQLFRPAKLEHPEFCALLNTGGNGSDAVTPNWYSFVSDRSL